MRTTSLRLGALVAVASLLAACADGVTSPDAPSVTGVSARGGSGGGGGGGGGGAAPGPVYTGIVDSVRIQNVGVYYPSYLDVYYSGGHTFRATTTIKIHSSSDVPLQAGACARFEYTSASGVEYTSDIKVLDLAKCGGA